MSEKRKTYTAEFKKAAVQLVTEQGRSIREAAQSLGVSEKQLRRWESPLLDQGEQAFPGHGKLPAVQEETRRLREENRRLRMGRDILKTATAFFAKESL